jgi:hypothetical protein
LLFSQSRMGSKELENKNSVALYWFLKLLLLMMKYQPFEFNHW